MTRILPFAMACLMALPASAAEGPASYDTPQAALDALMAGLAAEDRDQVLDVFGSEAADMLSTGNPDRDTENRAEVLGYFAEGYRFRPEENGSVTLLLGADAWPFPVPIARTDAGWSFDIEAGRDEIYFRRIGLNELDAIDIMNAYVAIQFEFRKIDHDGDGVMEFANALISSPDARDGLYWGDEDSPVGIRIALANLDGYSDDEGDKDPDPFGGYYFRILQGQSDAAPGGSMSYMIGDNMVAGHAMLAVPSDYGQSGIHSFMVSENGTVLQADLGEDSLEAAQSMTTYDPSEKWEPIE
ncbi:MAG: DUF2950 family protein [Paracoccaceae bacterium]